MPFDRPELGSVMPHQCGGRYGGCSKERVVVPFREDELMADRRARWALSHGRDENGEDAGPEAEMEDENVDNCTYIYIVGCTCYIGSLVSTTLGLSSTMRIIIQHTPAPL